MIECCVMILLVVGRRVIIMITLEADSLVENQNDLELGFKVFFFADSCCSDIVLDESN